VIPAPPGWYAVFIHETEGKDGKTHRTWTSKAVAFWSENGVGWIAGDHLKFENKTTTFTPQSRLIPATNYSNLHHYSGPSEFDSSAAASVAPVPYPVFAVYSGVDGDEEMRVQLEMPVLVTKKGGDVELWSWEAGSNYFDNPAEAGNFVRFEYGGEAG